MKTLKQIIYVLVGLTVTICMAALSLILWFYGGILQAIFHPLKSADWLVNKCGKFQDWIDKKLENIK